MSSPRPMIPDDKIVAPKKKNYAATASPEKLAASEAGYLKRHLHTNATRNLPPAPPTREEVKEQAEKAKFDAKLKASEENYNSRYNTYHNPRFYQLWRWPVVQGAVPATPKVESKVAAVSSPTVATESSAEVTAAPRSPRKG